MSIVGELTEIRGVAWVGSAALLASAAPAINSMLLAMTVAAPMAIGQMIGRTGERTKVYRSLTRSATKIGIIRGAAKLDTGAAVEQTADFFHAIGEATHKFSRT